MARAPIHCGCGESSANAQSRRRHRSSCRDEPRRCGRHKNPRMQRPSCRTRPPHDMKRFRFVYPAIASACVVLAILDAARPQYGGTLRIETHATIHAFDPAEGTDREEAAAIRRLRALVFETLVAVDPAGGLRPLLAVSWESDSAGRRWSFRLRRGVRLHDGSMLEAWQAAAALRSGAHGWTVSADGDLLVIEPPRPDPDLPWDLADPRNAIGVRRMQGERVGTGPFRFQGLEPGRVSVRAHEGYWNGRPFVDAIELQTGRSFNAQLASLESGRADVVELLPADARRATQRGFQVTGSRPLD